jgi:hypothetical protein
MAALGDILRVVADMSVGVGVTIENVYHVKVNSAGGVADSQALDDMGDYLEDVYSEINDHMTDRLNYDSYKVTNITADVELGAQAWPSLVAGGSAADGLADGIAGVASFRTSTPGHQGRKFWGPFSEFDVTDGRLTSATVADIQDAAVATGSPFTGAGGQSYIPVIYDRENNVGRAVTEAYGDNRPGYQRRRKPGVGA